eukprot:2188641-Rhodomonas_salina.1
MDDLTVSSSAASCNAANGSTLVSAAPDSDGSDTFGSGAILLGLAEQSGIPSGMMKAKITIPQANLGDVSTSTTAQDGSVSHKLFVGLAEFVSTGTRILDTAAQQVAITVAQSAFATITMTARGSVDYTFISFVNARAHSIIDAANEGTGTSGYYASVTFVVDAGLTVADGGQLVPTESIWTSTGLTCSQYANELDSLLAQSCGQQISVCEKQTEIDAIDRVGRIYIPLSESLGGTLGDTVDIEFPVTVLDSDGQAASTIVKVSLNTAEDRLVEWCDSEVVELVADVTGTLYVGTTTQNAVSLSSDLSAVPENAFDS